MAHKPEKVTSGNKSSKLNKMPEKNTIKCEDCLAWYNPIFPDAATLRLRAGRCYVFDSIDPLLRNPNQTIVPRGYSCRFGIKTTEDLSSLSAEEIADRANRASDSFFEKVSAKDVRLARLKADLARSSPKSKELAKFSSCIPPIEPGRTLDYSRRDK